MTGLRVLDRRGHVLLVADFADEDAIGSLAQGILQPHSHIQSVGPDLALIHDRLLVLENELHRLFERKNMSGSLFVAIVEHGCKRRRLSRSGRAHHQDEAPLLQDDVLEHWRQAERVERRDDVGNVAHHHCGRALLPEGADAETAYTLQGKCRVQFERVLVLLPLLLVDHFVEQTADGVAIHQLLIDGHGDAVDLDIDGSADRQEDVGGLLVGHQLEESLHRGHRHPPRDAAGRYSPRNSSLMLVFARVLASTCLTITAQYRPYLPSADGRVPGTTTDPAGTRP